MSPKMLLSPCVCLLLLNGICYGYYTLYDFDPYQAKTVVDEHNRLRAQEPAADMQEMVWNYELALVAKDWASRCAAMHRPGNDRVNRAGFGVIGENIWWSSESYLRSDLASIVRSLYNEKPFYSYGNNWCQPGQMCGHYTQVVWAKTCAVGCAASYCDYIYNGLGITRGHMVVCNYGPAGNYLNQFPYVYGSQCSSCPGSCRNGLCPSTCAANSWLPQAPAPPPPLPPPPAVQPVVPVVVATQPPAVVPPKQPSKPISIFSSNTKPEKVKTEIITSNGCTNQNPLCTFWGSTGECEKNQPYMNTYCMATCNTTCASSQPFVPQAKAANPTLPPVVQRPSVVENQCIDRDTLCPFWASTAECATNFEWMNYYCYASCHQNECGGKSKILSSTGCHDESVYCFTWSTTGECERNLFFMQWQCRKSCGLC